MSGPNTALGLAWHEPARPRIACRPIEVFVQPYGRTGSSSSLPAVVLVTPEERRIADDLPPTQR